ncbi:hypothetical protein ACFL6L_02715 [candidate division KSB1 bacterium]
MHNLDEIAASSCSAGFLAKTVIYVLNGIKLLINRGYIFFI